MAMNQISIEFNKLFTPLRYLCIRHDMKWVFDWFFPSVLTGIILCLNFMPSAPKMLGDSGLLTAITGLLQVLTGFYIAALAAVATFDRPSMDEFMKGTSPTLRERVKGAKKEKKLTRRRFLCFLFGYLAFISFFLYFAGNFAVSISESLYAIGIDWLVSIIKWGILTVYLFFFSQLIVTTLLGLHYLTERIHRD